MAAFTIQDRYYSCPVELTLSVVAGKWKILILWHLRRATLRFSELRAAMPDITDKMLSQQLRELDEDGLIHREVYPVVPPKTEYSLTEEGERMVPVLTAMQQWGMDYKVRSDTSPNASSKATAQAESAAS